MSAMVPQPRKFRSLDEIPDPPAEVVEAIEAFMRLYAPVIKALEKY